MAGYDVYLGDLMFPIAPEEINTSINGKNTTYDLINEGEMNILKLAGLTTVNFKVLLPAVKYPFATYMGGFQPPSYYLDKLEKLKQDKKPFQLVIGRNGSIRGRSGLHDTDMKVSLEDYKVVDKAGEGFDITVEINLKQFKDYKTKTFTVETPAPTAPVAVTPQREESSDPVPAEEQKKYSVTVYYSGSSGAVQSVSYTSTISITDARKKAYAKVPKTALWASETKKQATNQNPTLTDKALEAARKRVQEQQKTKANEPTQVKKPAVNKQTNKSMIYQN